MAMRIPGRQSTPPEQTPPIKKTFPASLPDSDLRKKYTIKEIQQGLTNAGYNYRTPTAPTQSNRVIANLHYLTNNENSKFQRIFDYPNNIKSITQGLRLANKLFMNKTTHLSGNFEIHNNTLIAHTQERESSLHLTLHPNFVSYYEAPLVTTEATSFASGSHKNFLTVKNKGVTIPITIESLATEKHLSLLSQRKKNAFVELQKMKANVIPRLTNKIMEAVQKNTPGAELIVIPQMFKAPTPENNNTLELLHSISGVQNLLQCVNNEYKNFLPCNAEKNKKRMRDILIANEALFIMGFYNHDIKLNNSIVVGEGKEERVLQIDIDDLAISRYTSPEDLQRILNKRHHIVRSKQHLYKEASELVSDISSDSTKKKTKASLHQSMSFLDDFNTLFPKNVLEGSTLLQCYKTTQFNKNPEFIFATTLFPVAFVKQLIDIYTHDPKYAPYKEKFIPSLNELIAKYNERMQDTNKTQIDSLRIRLSLLDMFTDIDKHIITNKKYSDELLNIIDSDVDTYTSDYDTITNILNDRKLEDSILLELKDVFLTPHGIQTLIHELRDIYEVSEEELSDADMEILVRCFIQMENALEHIIVTENPTNKPILHLANRLRRILHILFKTHTYTPAKNLPHCHGIIPVLSDADIAKVEATILTAREEEAQKALEQLALSSNQALSSPHTTVTTHSIPKEPSSEEEEIMV